MQSKTMQSMAVVITGASSGNGLAIARAFAARGAGVVLAGRDEKALQAAAERCRELGGRAHPIPTDVTDQEQVEDLARRALDEFGRIDIWVNNAGVTAFGKVGETPLEVHRRVMDTNYFGCLHGARAVLPHFRERRRGILVNIASVVAAAPQPYTSAYVTSKSAIRALSASIRMELALEKLGGVHVCTVMPASVDTPLFEHGANYTGRAPKPLPPVHDPEQVAGAVVGLASNPKREIIVGPYGYAEAAAYALLPGFYERYAAYEVHRNHFQERAIGDGEGNLFHPTEPELHLHGGWKTGGGSSTGRVSPLRPQLSPFRQLPIGHGVRTGASVLDDARPSLMRWRRGE